MQGVDRVAGKPLKQAIVEHRLCAAEALFSWLKNKDDRAIELAILHKVLSSAEQYGGMTVVAACVH
jgi:hypothetical protein